MKTALILGGGFAGCTTAYFLKKKGFQVTVIDSGDNPGGGVWTNFYGGHPYTFGPRVFFSKNDAVISHLKSLIKMRSFITTTWTYVEDDKKLYHYPIQESDIPLMPDHHVIQSQLDENSKTAVSVENFESYWISTIGQNLYSKFVNNYSKKMWGIESNKQLTANFEWVNRGTPIRNGDTRLYEDQYQGYPESLTGFNEYFLKCIVDVNCRLKTKILYFDPDKRSVFLSTGESISADIIVNTIHVDTLFDYTYGPLQYCGRDFLPIWLPIKSALPDDCTWIHYSGSESHTRVTEFKKITGFQSDSTLLGIEVPSSRGRYYPVQSKPEILKFNQYKSLFPINFYSIGRLGKFQYQGIPDAINDAIILSNSI